MDQAQQLRNVIKQRNQNYIEPARVITITSGKGGVGKSNTSVNLAVWLSRLGKRVIIFDADFGLANVEVMFGVIPKYTLADVIYENQTIKSIISNGPLGIDFISAGSSVVGLNNLNHKQIHFIVSAINELNSMYDFIIIDTGAGVSEQVMEFVAASNEIVLVTTPEPTSITDSYSLLKALYKRPDFDPSKVCIRVISNRAASKEDGSIVFNKINSVVMQFLNGSLEYLGYVPSDAMVEKAVRQQKILSIYDPTSKAARSFEAIVNLRGRHMEYTSLIFPGDKIDIFASGLSDNSTSYKSSFSDKLTDSMWEITMPVDSGRVVLFQLGTQFDFIIYTQNKTILKLCYSQTALS
mgnify:CR=1 FL=1